MNMLVVVRCWGLFVVVVVVAVMRDERNEIEIIKIPPIEGSKKSRERG